MTKIPSKEERRAIKKRLREKEQEDYRAAESAAQLYRNSFSASIKIEPMTIKHPNVLLALLSN